MSKLTLLNNLKGHCNVTVFISKRPLVSKRLVGECRAWFKGLCTAPLCAEMITAMISGEPYPVQKDIIEALHPNRFLVDALRARRGA